MELNGVAVLLQQLAIYKRHDPTRGEEGEMMYNLFDCVCSAHMVALNKKFLKGVGIQLMNLLVRLVGSGFGMKGTFREPQNSLDWR